MSLLGRALGRETRSNLATPSWDLVEALTGGGSYSGRSVSIDNSLQLVPVYSAVSLLSSAVGALPLMVYRRLENGRERATNHWMWGLLHDQPNPAMAADEMWELVTAHLLLWGNAYIFKVGHPIYPVGELWPVRPSRVQVEIDRETGERVFWVDGRDRYTANEILHIRYLGTDGVVGLSPVQQARQMLGASADQEEFLGQLYANSANPGGVLSHPQRLSDQAAERLKERWKQLHGGVAKAGEVAVLEEGMTWQSTGMPLADAQFIETRKFDLLQTALLFRVPPKMLGASTGDSLTYTSSEWESLDFVRWSLRHILVRIEQSLLRDPDLFIQGRRFYPEFLVEAMLRGTSKERAEFYQVALDPDKGWMRRDEVRELENLEPEPEPKDPPVDGTVVEDDPEPDAVEPAPSAPALPAAVSSTRNGLSAAHLNGGAR